MSAEDPKQPIVEIPPFTPPSVEIGETVWYFPSGNTNDPPVPGIVIECGRGPRAQLHIPQYGGRRWCRHAADPIVAQNINIRTEEGCWTYTEHGYKLRELFELLNQPKKKAEDKPKG